jgi:poly(U)-specific endoribonuclease
MFNESQVFSRPTYQSFRALLDNYEADASRAEHVTAEEEHENWRFLDAIMETSVMKEAHRFLVGQHRAPTDVGQFKQLLYSIWFKLYRRTCEDSSSNSSGFEHVFVGETRAHDVTGFHNWIQFYLQEKTGNIDYRGYFRRGTSEEMEKSPRLMTLQFMWNKGSGKPIGSSFIGTSPEFEVALFTTVFLMHVQKVRVQIKKYDVELVCHPHGDGIGTAYPVAKSR